MAFFMVDKFSQDDIYARPVEQIVDFVFDERVAGVFPDMIRRSVPGYENIIALTGLIAEQYVQENTNVYDLGCSLGAATFSMLKRVKQNNVNYIAVDNAAAMIEKCRANLQSQNSASKLELICDDILDITISNTSLVVMNFTLQFIAQAKRKDLLKKIFDGLHPSGVLVLSEKITFDDEEEREVNEALHASFKAANGYSELEISQKRTALEKVLVPDTQNEHIDRLNAIGFETVVPWFRCINFVSFLARK